MANRLPKAAAIVAAVIAVPLGAGVATAAPAAQPASQPSSQVAPGVVESVAHAKSLARLAHQRATPAAAPSSGSTAEKQARTQAPSQAAGPAAERAAATTGRLAGANRYDTAVAVSRVTYADGQLAGGTLVVAAGTQYPDALAGGPAAAGIGGPMLLVPPSGTVPASVIAEITRLGVEAVYIMGGTGAVDSDVEEQLGQVVDYVDRLFGDDRYATAAVASYLTWQFDEADPDAEPTPPSVVYLSSGATFADALAGGAAGAIAGAPLLLTSPSSLPDFTSFVLEDAEPTEVRILGGTGAVSGAVAMKVREVLPHARITRFAGADRYATAALTAQNLGLPTGGVVMLANGSTFPDALSASTSSAVIGAPVLLVQQSCSPAATTAQVNRLAPRLVRAVGGKAIVSDAALARKAC